MFECKFRSGQTFKELINTISSFVEDGELVATPNGLELRAIDESRIAMIDLFVSKDICETYTCDEDVKLKINFNDLDKVVSRTSGNEEVNLRFLADTNKLQIKFKGKSTRTFSIPLVEEVKCESIQGASLSSDVEIKINASTLSQAIKDAKQIDDLADFIVQSNGEFSLSVNSDKGDLRIDFEENAQRNDANTNVISKYSLDYLTKILKASVLSDEVTIEFSKENPIVLKFPILNDESNGRIIYFLAPQVEEEEIDEESEDEEVPEIYDEDTEE
ncbi:MAG: proliferating cell nuclear antigen (pcna) [Candidatus Helarchaeota archaeon]